MQDTTLEKWFPRVALWAAISGLKNMAIPPCITELSSCWCKREIKEPPFVAEHTANGWVHRKCKGNGQVIWPLAKISQETKEKEKREYRERTSLFQSLR